MTLCDYVAQNNDMALSDALRTIFPFFGNQAGPSINEGLQGDNVPRNVRSVRASNFDSAMQVSTWWACTRLLTEIFAAIPLDCYERQKNKKVKTDGYSLWRLISFFPNQYQTRIEFFECLMLNLVTGGNWYVKIQRANNNPNGRIIGLLPLMNSRVKVHLIKNRLVYEYTAPDGTTAFWPHEKIWHVKIFGNGVTGLSPLQHGAASVGIAIDSRDRAQQLAASGGKTNGILMIDKELQPEQRATIRRNFAGLVEGSEDDLWILEHNMKFERTALSPGDAQLLESWKFSVEEICRFFGIPSILVNDTSASTTWGSGIYQIVQGFYKLTLRPYSTRIQSSLLRWLVPQRDWGRIEFVHNFDALLEMDLKSRFEAFNKAINSGLLSPNEAREEERRPPKPGGNEIYLNGSLRPARLAAKAATPNTAGGRRAGDTPPPAPDDNEPEPEPEGDNNEDD